MRTATKFVVPLTDEERLRLKAIHKTDPNWRTRMRAQAILLSEKGFALNARFPLTLFLLQHIAAPTIMNALPGLI